MKYLIYICLLSCLLTASCKNIQKESSAISPMETNSKPWARYWWFASEIKKKDIKYNLDWLKEKGFGGVEIAWVYPLNAMNPGLDTALTPRHKWLGREWQDRVSYAIQYCDSLGLACDLTLGTLWPFGDSKVSYEQASQVFGSEERQLISRSWEFPLNTYVVDHLDPEKYLPYFKRLIDSFPRPHVSLPQAYFIDSWEVECARLWSDSMKEDFLSRYNYDISPFMDSVYSAGYEDYLYDYMKLLSNKVLRFYADFDSCLNSMGILSRGQCSGAPVDIISAYSLLDIPEGESMLYEPEFNSIPASAAALSNKNIVSAETFTCLYGWPRNYIRQEQTADLKLVADALFANGINHIVWHGKAHNHAGQDTTNFYASVHLGDSGKLINELKEFNSYLETVSHYMKKGSVYTDVAVYLPLEEAWIKGIMPPEKQFIWAWGYYEMRYIYFPAELKGFHPIWINGSYLKEGLCEDGVLKIGDVSIKHLYIDTKYIDYEVLKQLVSLSDKGLEITIKQTLLEPGINKHADWDALMARLLNNPGVSSTFSHGSDPLIRGINIPAYRARVEGESLYVFFADPRSENIKFPLKYGQSLSTDTVVRDLEINYRGFKYNLRLSFEPNQSLLYTFENANYNKTDISFFPRTPQQITKADDSDAPWLVKK